MSAIGAVWLVTELAMVIPGTKQEVETHSGGYIFSVCVIDLVSFLCYIYETRWVQFKVPTTDTDINIKFGDLFAERCSLLIPVNEFFDSALGQIVAPASIHGQFIRKFFASDEKRFRGEVDAALCVREGTPTERKQQPNMKYPIGTTAVVRTGEHQAFLVAMAHTDIHTAKASATVPMLWVALEGVLKAVHEYGNGGAIALPLIGNGQSSVNIEPQHLLRLIVLSLVDFGRKTGLPKSVTIVVHEACFELIDIREIARDWRKR